jgi:RHS repeat-associated protein
VIDEIVNGYQLDATGKLVNTTYHHDALHSVLGQSGHEGSILAKQTYSSFGSILSQTGLSNNTQKYTGREIDNETGLYNYRNRIYDPTTGRFISEDPKRFAADVNFYAYAGNNPLSYNDPFGLTPYDIDVARRIAIEAYGPELKFPDRYGSSDLIGDNGGYTIYGSYTTLNRFYSGKLSDKEAAGLLNTIIHEAIHWTYPPGDSRNTESDTLHTGYPYSQAATLTTKKLIQRLNIERKIPIGVNPASSVIKQISPQSNLSPSSSGVVDSTLISSINTAMGSINSIGAPQVPLGTLSVDVLGFDFSAAASGGYVLYPSKPNNNMAQSVYRK